MQLIATDTICDNGTIGSPGKSGTSVFGDKQQSIEPLGVLSLSLALSAEVPPKPASQIASWSLKGQKTTTQH
jgi:hypothetical protein